MSATGCEAGATIGDMMLILGLRLQLHAALESDDRDRIKVLTEQIAALEKAVLA